MRGPDSKQETLFSYVSLESRIPVKHPRRPIRAMISEALAQMDQTFEKLYSDTGRPSIAPERLIRALLLQVLYTIRSERLLVEQLEYNLLFRWFVGLSVDERVITSSSRSDERKALLDALQRFKQADIEPRITCMVLRTNEEVSEYAEWLASVGIDVLPLTRDVSDDDERAGIRVATMHRVKGLESDAVVIAGYRGAQRYAEMFSDEGDAGVMVDMLTNERCLLHVAATRAKRALVVSQIEN